MALFSWLRVGADRLFEFCRDARKDSKAFAAWRKKTTYWKWTYCVRLLLIICFSAFVFLIDPFGLQQAAGIQSEAIGERVTAPWYRSDKSAESSDTVVVLMTRRMIENDQGNIIAAWPPSRRLQSVLFVELLKHCPKAVFIDIYYDSVRDLQDPFFVSLLKARSEAKCENDPRIALIFADKLNSDSRATDVAQTRKLARAFYLTASSSSSSSKRDSTSNTPERKFNEEANNYVDELKERYEELDTSNIGIALSEFPVVSKESRYFGTSHARYYPLVSPLNGEGSQNSKNSTELKKGRDSRRLSPALAMYLYGCALETPRWETCDRVDIDSADVFKETASGWTQSPEKLKNIDSVFGAPLDVQWQHYSPAINNSAWSQKIERAGSSDGCEVTGHISFMDRLTTSLSNLLHGFLGSRVKSRLSEQSSCFPLVTVPARLMAPLTPFTSDAQEFINGYLVTAIKDKFVFVGLGDPGGGDVTFSPTHGPLPGVFNHAMAFDNLKLYGARYTKPPSLVLDGQSFFGFTLNTVDAVALFIEILMLRVTFVLSRKNRQVMFARWSDNRIPAKQLWLGDVFLVLDYVVAALFLLVFSLIISLILWNWLHVSLSNWIGIGLAVIVAMVLSKLDQ